MRIRRARPGDADDVRAIAESTWTDRDREDYLQSVFEEWIATDGEDQCTVVAVDEDRAIGTVQTVLLTQDEAWQQGMRVAPEYRGQGVGTALTQAGFEWVRERGAAVARSMVFAWNAMGLGLARSAGYDPGPEFRWSTPDPDSAADPTGAVTEDVTDAWTFWTRSRARDELAGLGLHPDESWSLATVTPSIFERARKNESLLVIREDGTAATTYRTRVVDRETADGTERRAVYGAAAWRDPTAACSLFDAIAADAAAVGADAVRVLIPETTRAVGDVARCRRPIGESPDFVLEADLIGPFPDRSPR
ncbi:MAG: GNAT family N-acetyltransferase [Halanaeroarchaeum sp.]